MISNMLNLDENLTKEQLKEIIARGYAKIKYKSVTNDNEIRKIFIQKMDKFITQIENLKMGNQNE